MAVFWRLCWSESSNGTLHLPLKRKCDVPSPLNQDQSSSKGEIDTVRLVRFFESGKLKDTRINDRYLYAQA